MPFPIMAAMALGQLLLSQQQQGEQNENDKKVAAETTRMSPWTNLKAGEIRKVDTAGNVMKALQAYAGAGGTIPGVDGAKAAAGGAAEAAGGAARAATPLNVDYSPLEKFASLGGGGQAPGGGAMSVAERLSPIAKPMAAAGAPGTMDSTNMQKLAKMLGINAWSAME
jgi:hypothetical protein